MNCARKREIKGKWSNSFYKASIEIEKEAQDKYSKSVLLMSINFLNVKVLAN